MNELNQEIRKKITGWKRTRYNRINISKRFKKYDSRWNIVMFFMNAFAIVLIIISLNFPLKNGIDTVIAGCFSIYVILLQYFLANENYRTRSLKFHYEQLEIEKLRYSLKSLLRDSSLKFRQKQGQYSSISDQYLISLKNNENHDKIDDAINSSCNVTDRSLDNIFFYINLFFFIGVVFGVISIYFYYK